MFGIFKYKPSPFCLLDEIDAPLDDANTGRFLDMLRELQARDAVHPHHAQPEDDGDRRPAVRRDDGGAGRVEADLGQAELSAGGTQELPRGRLRPNLVGRDACLTSGSTRSRFSQCGDPGRGRRRPGRVRRDGQHDARRPGPGGAGPGPAPTRWPAPTRAIEIVNVNGTIDVEAVDGNTLEVKARAHRARRDRRGRQGGPEARSRSAKRPSAASVRLEARYPRGPAAGTASR